MTILDEVRSPSLEEQFAALPPTLITPKRDEPFSARLVRKLGDALLSRTSRRGFLAGTAVAGAALVTAPKTYALTPTSAYQSVCGGSASCGAGYTAFCCTINAGKNQCPPGSLAGGWWKADGSGFCCGSARYYIDCHYTCSNCGTGCGGYKSFCRAGCHAGSCYCANGECDKRRVNCNYFRYGQCNTDIPCTGPVLCRVITCTPPWKLFSCTTSSATDNYTGNHNASCLYGPGCLPAIDQWWWDHGGKGSVVGAPVDGAVRSTAVGGGTTRRFANGTIYNTPTRGLLFVMTPLSDTYYRLGSELSPLGLPIANQVKRADGGVVQQFEKGMLTWLAPQTPVVALYGDALARFNQIGGFNAIGYPAAATLGEPMPGGGVRDAYTDGYLYRTPSGALIPVPTALVPEYRRQNEAKGPLGYPTGTIRAAGLKSTRGTKGSVHQVQDFQNGRIELVDGVATTILN